MAGVLLGITGGIAAYKIPHLVRLLVSAGHSVQPVMTDAAEQFVTPLTLATLSGKTVFKSMWGDRLRPQVEHISLADEADVAVIAPATANFLGKAAAGIADDMLTTVFTALTCPVILCPAMNVNMYRNPVVQRNLKILEDLGYRIMQPGSGDLACGYTGEGRMPEPEEIFDRICRELTPQDLAGIRILVTAGPTEEPIDPVRFLTNRSSGKMGVAAAKRALARGADVTMVAGPMKVPVPAGVLHIAIRTAREMYDAVIAAAEEADVVIKTAAVADYRPSLISAEKMKKSEDFSAVELVKNPDILQALGDRKRSGQILVGFAAETNDLVANARKKLNDKKLDLLVLNDVTQEGAGFDSDTNIVRIFHGSGEEESLDIMPKEAVADAILDRVVNLRSRRTGARSVARSLESSRFGVHGSHE